MDKRVSHCSEFHFRALGRCCGTTYVLLALLLGIFSISASAASFDCKKAKTAFEKRVCSNPELSRLDDELAAAYKVVMSKTADIDGLKMAQRGWWTAVQRKPLKVFELKADYKRRIEALRFSVVALTGDATSLERVRVLAERALHEKLDCRAEPLSFYRRTPDKWSLILGRNQVYLECLSGLLLAKQFDQLKYQIQVLDGNSQIWGARFLTMLSGLPNLMLHGINGVFGAVGISDCNLDEEKEKPYSGSELYELLRILLGRIDLNADDPIQKQGTDFLQLFYFIGNIQHGDCIDQAYKAGVINILLDFGMKTTFWYEPNSVWPAPIVYDAHSVSGLMVLGDQQLVRRIFKSGISADADTAMLLALHAPNIEMVRLAEKCGFRMSKNQAIKALRLIEEKDANVELEGPNSDRWYPPVDFDPELYDYIQSLAE